MKKLLLSLLTMAFVYNTFAGSDKYRLCFRDNPSTSIVVGWDNLGGSNHRIYFDTENHGQDTAAYTHVKYPDRTEDEKGMENTFARLNGLTPNTAYFFVVCDDNFISDVMWFETIPDDPNVKLSLIFGGDSRSNQDKRQNANKMVAKLRAHAVIFGGDYVDDGTDEEWEAWFDDWQLTISEDGRCTPLLATQGNHELIWTNFPHGNDVVDKLFDTPGGEHYFAMDFGGSLIRIYSLDAEYPTSLSYGDQTDWFEEDLSNNAPSRIWLTAQFHSPVRPHNEDKGEGSKQYDEWVPLFDEYNFAFVHENDAHLCKQTWPVRKSSGSGSEEGFIRDDYNGTVYIGEGGWGAPLRDNDDNKSWTRNSAKMNQFKWIFVSQDTIEIRTVLTDDVNDVQPLSPTDDRFSMPDGISLWEPSNGPVVIIQKWTTPECAITSPPDGTHYPDPQAITITAEASDPHGIDEVQFYLNGELLETDTNEPWEINYNIPNEGLFYFSAKALNNQGILSPASEIVTIGCGELSNTISIITDDDAEENLDNGSVDLESGDIELTRESGWMGLNDYNQIVGIRFQNVNLPQNAIINEAWIQFRTDETNNDNPCNLTIKAEAVDNSPAFQDNDDNISDRNTGNQSVNWSPEDWNSEGEESDAQKTPDISNLVTEVINRPGWQPNNAIAIIITGDGRRNAKSNDAELFISYTVNVPPDVEITNPANQAIFTSLEAISLEVETNDFDGTIDHVDYYINGSLSAQSSTEPWSASYTLPAYQEYEVYAVAYDNLQASTQSETVTFKANTPPQVELFAPGSDTLVYGLPEITLKAFASDDGEIMDVKFYTTGNNLIGTYTEYPYTCNWTVPFYGSFELKAVATDNDGLSTTSETIMLNAEFNTLAENSTNSGIRVYPNPVDGILHIQLDDKIGRDKPLLAIYDMQQKVLLQQFVKASTQNEIMIDVSGFKAGAYVLQIQGKSYTHNETIIIQH